MNKQSVCEGAQSVIKEIVEEKTVKSYTRGNFLGQGGFAKCYEASDIETGVIYAVKIINKASFAKESAKKKVYLVLMLAYV